MTSYGFHPAAYQELMAAAQYYEHEQQDLGLRFLDMVDRAIERLCRHPEAYRLVDEVNRQCRVPHFSYGLIYRIKHNRIEILAVMHLHREPGYWKKR